MRSTAISQLVIAAGLLAPVQVIVAHSWVEQLLRIAPNGTMVGPAGFIRGYVGRSPGFDEALDLNLIPPNGRPDGKIIHSDDLMCRSTQTVGNYSTEYPMLRAAPGDLVALRYQENGHVTLPLASKPENRGTVYIYGTTSPSNNDTLLAIHKVWTADGQGGDRRGRLLATRNFDDGQCYQVNDGPISVARQALFKKAPEDPQGADLWCQADVRLPADMPETGTYTIYWVWDWPTMSAPTASSKRQVARGDRARRYAMGNPVAPRNATPSVVIPEIYTSCMDIEGTSEALSAGQALSFETGQDLNNAAISAQLSDNFLVNVSGAGPSTTSTSVPACTL
ncbi:hypothetical protein NKR23_g12135 [Pleurostoma richardsiae]|uniref:DUF7492 domain-containing protein n=1 Tax=Pleurostoma richardsiae TaxID=41990 RepID=A0AA38R6G9_9PEZI|nr:hypothetical protein NKR23_g12135 [Pleurostoma richardsiae]